MSAEAAEAYHRWFAQHEADCARDLVVGAKVYRAREDDIEEGVVRRVSRCWVPASGEPREDEKGPHPYYIASFRNDWVGQIYQWEWFFRVEDARKHLCRKLRAAIERKREDIARLEALIAANTPPPP